ncbi:hypothetical protein ABPG77_006691 [Micractinium sp. CCAP 211/92]
MGCLQSKLDSATVDKVVDAAVQNKEKVKSTTERVAGAKAAQQVESALSGDKEGLKASVNKALGNKPTATAAAPAATESAPAATPAAEAAESAPATAAAATSTESAPAAVTAAAPAEEAKPAEAAVPVQA